MTAWTDLTAEQIADLRQLQADPHFELQPQRRKAFVRAGLIHRWQDAVTHVHCPSRAQA